MLSFSGELAGVLARAYSGGTEITIESLASMLGSSEGAGLEAVQDVTEFVGKMDLQLAPGLDEGDLGTPRILRTAGSSQDGAERALRLISEGETQVVEFKSSVFVSMRQWDSKQELVEMPTLAGEVLKTICAFLNTDGGDLFIGVDDDGTASGGIELDLRLKKWTLDKWQLHLFGLISGRFYEGKQVLPYVRLSFFTLDGKLALHVEVAARSSRSFVQRDKQFEYFIRNGARSDSLDLVAFEAHLRERGRTG